MIKNPHAIQVRATADKIAHVREIAASRGVTLTNFMSAALEHFLTLPEAKQQAVIHQHMVNALRDKYAKVKP